MVYYCKNWRARRSVLFMPASNQRALSKATDLDCDGLIFDLEDSVSEEEQEGARSNLLEMVGGRDFGQRETIIRVSSPSSPDYEKDVETAIACRPDAILLPKVEYAKELAALEQHLDREHADIDIWAMIETPRALVNLGEICGYGNRLNCLVVGPNDLSRETGTNMGEGRFAMISWLMNVIAYGRANGLVLLDGVYNAFRDLEGLKAECHQGVSLGFDGKTLIHPSQIKVANEAFSPGENQIEFAKAVVELFERPENLNKNALQLDGEMVERLHYENARNLLALNEALN